MSKQGSKKEAIYTLYQKKHPYCIEQLIGLSISGIKTEVSRGAKRIDLYAVNKDKKVEIFIENQLKPSDRKDHLEQKIIPLIDGISEGYVIWTATKFKKEHIDAVKFVLRANPQKYINFYAVEINQEFVSRINALNGLYELEVWDNLDALNEIENKFEVVDSYQQMPPNHIGKAHAGNYIYDFKREDDIKEYMIVQLRERIPYFLNFHGEKKHSQHDRILKVGAGLTDIMFCGSACDVRFRSFVEVKFGRSKVEWYQRFKSYEDKLKTEIDSSIQFNDKYRTIGVYTRAEVDDIQKTVEQLIILFEKFILYFSPYTYKKHDLTMELLTV